MNTPIRFGVVGCGRMGRRRMETAVEHPRTAVTCVTDVDDELAAAAAADFECAVAGSSADLVERDDVDCVVVSVPNRFHLPIVRAALEGGKRVFCEKPLARDTDEALAIARASLDHGLPVKVGSNLRFFPNVLKAKELVDSGAIGETMFLRGWIGHDGWNLGDTWFADPEMSGGGTFLDNGCHVLDLIRWFLGEVVECSGFVQTTLWSVEPLEDNGFAIFRTADGKTAFAQASWTEWAGYCYLEVYGADGFVRIDARGRACETVLGDRQGNLQSFDFSDRPPSSYRDEFADYVESLEKGAQPAPNVFDGLRAVQMARGVYESSRAGRTVDIYGETERRLAAAFAAATSPDAD